MKWFAALWLLAAVVMMGLFAWSHYVKHEVHDSIGYLFGVVMTWRTFDAVKRWAVASEVEDIQRIARGRRR